MTALSERLRQKLFGKQDHPYTVLEKQVEAYLHPSFTLLDAGCGSTAPLLAKFNGRVAQRIGVDLTGPSESVSGIEFLQNDLGSIELADSTVDLVVSRSVMEHLRDPARAYKEIYRILKPGGYFIFLTSNLWDYAAIIAKLVPNRFHPWIVSRTEGRQCEDVFPVLYRSNTFRAVSSLCRLTGFEIVSFRYLGQYPCYFMFNGALFLLAALYEKILARFEALRSLRGWILVVLTRPSQSNTKNQPA
jgi:SAM-dependent methyltransferase